MGWPKVAAFDRPTGSQGKTVQVFHPELTDLQREILTLLGVPHHTFQLSQGKRPKIHAKLCRRCAENESRVTSRLDFRYTITSHNPRAEFSHADSKYRRRSNRRIWNRTNVSNLGGGRRRFYARARRHPDFPARLFYRHTFAPLYGNHNRDRRHRRSLDRGRGRRNLDWTRFNHCCPTE